MTVSADGDPLTVALDELAALALGGRLSAQLQAELDSVREAAAELLGLSLSVPVPSERLVPDLRFFYPAAEDAGQTELLADAIRRRFPGEAGRRRARAYVHREAAELIPRLIGRARGDLQYQLADAARRMTQSASARYTESTGRLEEALRAADVLRSASAQEAARRDEELTARLARLDRVLSLLAGGPGR